MLRKLLSIMLSVCILLTAVSVTQVFASAEDTDIAATRVGEFTSGDFTYDLLGDGTATIASYEGDNWSVWVPSECNGVTVTAVSGSALRGNENVEWLVLPPTVKTVGDNAFKGCPKLERFWVYSSDESSLTSIGSGAFENCAELYEAQLPDSVTSIGDYAFSGCTSLEKIEIGAAITSIGNNAFRNCGSGFTIYGVKGSEAEEYAKKNNILFFSEGDFTYKVINGVAWISGIYGDAPKELVIPSKVGDLDVAGIQDWAFSDSMYIESVVIPEPVTTVGNGAFALNMSLEKVTLPDTLTTIGNDAFAKNPSLKEINFPSSLRTIGNSAFDMCDSLTSVVLNEGLTSIDDYSFAYCSNLESITIPASVKTIGENAFKDSGKLIEGGIKLNITGAEGSYAQEYANKKGIPFKASGIAPSETPTEVTLDPVDLNFDLLADGSIKLTGYTGNATVIEIPAAINGKTVSEIGDDVFSNKDNITSISIPEGVRRIGEYSFAYSDKLESISFPDSLYSVKEGAFSATPWYRAQPEGIVYAGKVAYDFKGSVRPTQITLRDDTTGIAAGAFSGETSLESIAIPPTVKAIEDKAFQSCSALTEIEIPASVVTIGERVFNGCDALTALSVDPANTYYDSRNDCNAIIETATNTLIAGCAVTEIPDTVKVIGPYAFADCKSMTSIHVPGNVETILESAFSECSNVSSVTLDEGIIRIEELAFNGVHPFGVIIPRSVRTIVSGAIGYHRYTTSSGWAPVHIVIHFDRYTNFIIFGYAGTEAQHYAEECNLTFIEISEEDPTEVPTEPVTLAPTEPATQEPTTAPTLAPVKLGDANGDGEVDSVDATVVQRAATRIQVPYSEEQLMCADIDGDGSLTIVDATFIQRYDSKIAVPYPVGEAK